MAEHFWRTRIRTASAILLFGTALLCLVDALDRQSKGQHVGLAITLSLCLVVTGGLSLVMPWRSIGPLWRAIPFLTVVAATMAAISDGAIFSSPNVAVGLSVVGAMALTYLGVVSRPGVALLGGLVVLGVMLVASIQEPDAVGLAVPLFAIPVSALVAELISALAARTKTISDRDVQRIARLTKLEDVLRGFRRPGSLIQAADQVAIAARDIFEVQRVTVVLRDAAGGLIPVTIGPPSPRAPDKSTADLVSETIGGKEPLLVPTGYNGTMLVLPLPAAEAPAGAVLVYPVPDDDPSFTLDLARLFGVQVGIAIEHLFEIDKLSKASTRDELTGLGNRRHADALLQALQVGDAVIVLDLDGFKRVNDTFGHPAGDEVLRELSAHLQDALRDSDTSARLGGDEFLIVARRAHADPLAVAERVINGWSSANHAQTTLSAGVALHQPGVKPDDTFQRADQALLKAKAAGKNQANLYTTDVE